MNEICRHALRLFSGLFLFLISTQGCSSPEKAILIQPPPPDRQPLAVGITAVVRQRAPTGFPAHAQTTLANALSFHATNSGWFQVLDSGGESRLVAAIESLELGAEQGSFNLIDSQCDRLDTEEEITISFIRCRITVSLRHGTNQDLTKTEAVGKGEETLRLSRKATTKTMSGWRAQGGTDAEMNAILANEVIRLATKRALADFIVHWRSQR